MDPKNSKRDQHDTRVVCSHCNKLFPSPEALWLHRREIRANTNTTPTTPHLLVNGKMSSMHQHNKKTSVSVDTLINQHYMYMNQCRQVKEQNHSQNAQQGTANNFNMNQSKNPVNTTNESLQNQQNDSHNAYLRTVRYFQQNNLNTRQSDKNQTNQDNINNYHANYANINQFYQNRLENNSNESTPIPKAYLSVRHNAEDNKTDSNALKHEQTIIFEDRTELHKLLSNDEIEAQKAAEAQTGTKNNQIVHNNAQSRPASTFPAALQESQKAIPSTKLTEDIDYDIRYKCRLCEADFANKENLMKHAFHTHGIKPNIQAKDKINKSTKVAKPLVKVMENKESEGNDEMLRQDPRVAEILPRIVSIKGNDQLVRKIQSILNDSNKTTDQYIEEDIEYIPETEQETKTLHQNEEGIEYLSDNCISNVRRKSISIANNTGKNINQRKRKEEGRDSGINRKRYKHSSDDTSSSDYDTSDDETQRKKIKTNLQKPNRKNRKDSEEDLQLSSDTDRDNNMLKQMTEYLKELVFKTRILKQKDYLEQLIHSKKNKSKTKSKQKLYKCKKCSIHFMNKRKLRKHLKKGKHDDKKNRCVICKLKFPKKSLKKHIEKHHIDKRLQRKDFDIITNLNSFKSSDTYSTSTNSDNDNNITLKKNNSLKLHYQEPEPSTSNAYEVKRVKNNVKTKPLHDNTKVRTSTDNNQSTKILSYNKTTSQPLSNDPKARPSEDDDENFQILRNSRAIPYPLVQISGDDKQSLKILNDSKETSQTLPNNPAENCKYKVYKCGICDICFMSPITWKNHMTLSNHKPMLTKRNCTMCGLNFTRISMEKHISLHHNESTDLSNLEIINWNDKEPLEVNNDLEDEPQVVSRMKNKEKKTNKVNNKLSSASKLKTIAKKPIKLSHSYSNTVYQCRLCKVYFLTYAALVRHIYMRRHDRRNVARCSMCGLSFYRVMVERHIDIHHKKLRLKDKSEFQVKVLPTSNKIARKYTDRINSIKEDKEVCYKATRSQNKTSEKVKPLIQEDSRRSERKKRILLASVQQEIKEQEELEKEAQNQEDNKNNDSDLMSQNMEDVDDRLYKCLKCNIHYFKEQSFIYHMEARRHNFKNRYPCPICRYTFSVIFLRKHISIQHFKLRIEKFNIVTSTQDDDDKTQVTPCKAKLKDCVVQLTSLQSALVSTTSNDGLNDETQLPVTTDENSSQSDVKINQPYQQTVDKYENEDHDEDNIAQNKDNVRNTVIVPNVKILSDVVIKTEKQQDSVNDFNTSSTTNSEQNINKNEEISTANNTISETSVLNDNMTKMKENLLITETNKVPKDIEAATEAQKPDINTKQNSLHETAADIITKGLVLMESGPIVVESDTSCDSDSSTSGMVNKAGQCSGNENKVSKTSDSFLTEDIVNGDNAIKVDDQIGEVKKSQKCTLNKSISRSTESLLATLSGTEDCSSSNTTKIGEIHDDETHPASETDVEEQLEELLDIERKVHEIQEILPKEKDVSGSINTNDLSEINSNEGIRSTIDDEMLKANNYSTVTENNQNQNPEMFNEKELNETNTTQKPSKMSLGNENEFKSERVNIKFPIKNNMNAVNLDASSRNIDLPKTCQDVAELDDDFLYKNLNASTVKVTDTAAVDSGVDSSNVDIEKTIQNIKQERDDDVIITSFGPTDEVILISDDEE